MKVDIRGNIIALDGVSAGFVAHPDAVEPYVGVPEDTVKTQHKAVAFPGRVKADVTAVPAHTGLGVTVAHGLVAVGMAGQRVIGHRGHPVVRQAYIGPGAVVKALGVGALVMDRMGLGEVVEILGACAKVFLRRGGVAQAELPALVQAHGLRPCQGAYGTDKQGNYNAFHTKRVP